MRKLFYLFVIIFLTACKKHSNDNGIAPAPAKVALQFPAQNSACTTGTVVSPVQSVITLTWSAAANTDSYTLGLKNLLTQTITYRSTTSTQTNDTLLRNTPYSWFIVSRSSSTADTAKSDTWKFYNSGPGSTAYAPFPADLQSPTYNQIVLVGTTTLTWAGSSIDNDITGYDIYFGTNPTPPLYQSNSIMQTINVPVTTGNTYYWRIVTKDLTGNSVLSAVFQFKTP